MPSVFAYPGADYFLRISEVNKALGLAGVGLNGTVESGMSADGEVQSFRARILHLPEDFRFVSVNAVAQFQNEFIRIFFQGFFAGAQFVMV